MMALSVVTVVLSSKGNGFQTNGNCFQKQTTEQNSANSKVSKQVHSPKKDVFIVWSLGQVRQYMYMHSLNKIVLSLMIFKYLMANPLLNS